jgi:hypothetical protein
MMKLLFIIFTLVMVTTSARASIILQSGESFSEEFTLLPTPNTFKLTDNYWDIYVDLIDSGAPPFTPGGNAGTLTLSLFENTDLSGLITSFSIPTSFPEPEGLLFFGNQFGLGDFNGSLTLQYEGDGEATLNSIFVGIFAGDADPSGVSSVLITPEGMPSEPPITNVSAPAMYGVFFAMLGLMLVRRAK